MADYSCYITVFNNSEYKLAWTHQHAGYGYWKVKPEGVMDPNTITTYVLADSSGLDGSGGSCEFQVYDQKVHLDFSCPTTSANSAAFSSKDGNWVQISRRAVSAIDYPWGTDPNGWPPDHGVPASGHPLSIVYWVANTQPSS